MRFLRSYLRVSFDSPPASNLVKVNGLGTHERILPLTLLVTALWLMVFFRVRSAFSGVFVERVP